MFLIGTTGDSKKVEIWLNMKDCSQVINEEIHIAPNLLISYHLEPTSFYELHYHYDVFDHKFGYLMQDIYPSQGGDLCACSHLCGFVSFNNVRCQFSNVQQLSSIYYRIVSFCNLLCVVGTLCNVNGVLIFLMPQVNGCACVDFGCTHPIDRLF